MRNRDWSWDELVLAFNLYCKTPFTKINASNKAVKELANIIGRSDSAVALKLANYARLDPALQKREIKGMRHGSKGEEEIWEAFNGNWEELSLESEKLLARFKGVDLATSAEIETEDLPDVPTEREALVAIRTKQRVFQKMVLASFDNRCCITGISNPKLLNASHIVPWKDDVPNRLNPRNGLCLNVLHDRAFDRGLITVMPDLTVVLSRELRSSKAEVVDRFFKHYEGTRIELPQRFLPDSHFLEYHNKHVFVR